MGAFGFYRVFGNRLPDGNGTIAFFVGCRAKEDYLLASLSLLSFCWYYLWEK